MYSKFVAIGIDECHCLENWGGSGFRVDYQNLGTLREAFPSIPFVGLTATMTPMGTSYFFKSARFKKPAIIKQTVRRRNVNIWVVPISPITQNEYEGLHILFPDNISSPEDIPQTIIFYNGRVGCGRMAKWLRSQLPAAHGSESETIVRSYSGVLDEMSKRETLELLRGGACRMVACTDAFGLGMNIKAIPRVVVWKLDSKLGIDGLHQRTGRAGRDSIDPALALIFVTNANLSGQYVSPAAKATVETAKGRKTKQKIKTKRMSPSETPASPTDNGEFRYTLPVNKETEPTFRKALPDIYAGPTKKPRASCSESNLPHSVHWVVQTEGCRQQPFLVAFDDPEMMIPCEIPNGCDRCLMRHLIETDKCESAPTVHRIPFTITLAYRTYAQTSTNKPRKQRKQTVRTIPPERMDKLVTDIKAWREKILQDYASNFAGMSVRTVLPGTTIVAIAGKAKYVRSEDDFMAGLRECGYSVPGSFICSYSKDLYDCICSSLKESHPPPQLQAQFEKAAGRSRQAPQPQPWSTGHTASREITHSTPSIPPYPQPRNQLHQTIVNPLVEDTTTPQVPDWPVPPILEIVPTNRRVPLAEKDKSNPSITMNIAVTQLPASVYNTRQFTCRQSKVKQLSTLSDGCSAPTSVSQNNLSPPKNLRKRDQPGDENALNQSARKKCKSKQMQGSI